MALRADIFVYVRGHYKKENYYCYRFEGKVRKFKKESLEHFVISSWQKCFISVNETEFSLRLEQSSVLERQLLTAFLLLLILCK